MEATIVSDTLKHYPVLLKEIISVITPQHGGTFIDCTFGQGGYTKEILKYKNTKVIGLDRDIDSKIIGKKIEKQFPGRFLFKNLKFSNLNNLKLKNEDIRAILFDLGYSFIQIKDPKKGLSFNSNGKLNMMMGINDFSASDVVNKLNEKEIEKILKYFADERDAKIIAKNIVRERKLKKINTQELVKIIENSKRKKNYKTHSSTKTFQALRIYVNNELNELKESLNKTINLLNKNGLILVVSFQSLEDRIVKDFFNHNSGKRWRSSRHYPELPDQMAAQLKIITKKPIVPSVSEISKNPRSRSAKLRVAQKIK